MNSQPQKNNMQTMQKKSPIMLVSIITGLILLIGITGLATNGFGMIKQETKMADKMMSKSTDKMMKKEDSMMSKSNDTMMKKEADSMMSKPADTMTAMSKTGDYRPYSVTELVNAKEGQHVIIFFNATWCPTCQSTVKDIEANKSKIASNVLILSADYDKETALKQKYGVTMQHTFVEVDSSGNLIKKTTGLATVDAINNYLK